jgi:hypothetical protein
VESIKEVHKTTSILLRKEETPLAKYAETGQEVPRKRPPARTPEARENQLINLAFDLVEKRLRNGTATSQETTHFLKRGSLKERTEQEILEKQKDLITAKTEQIQSQKRVEELYANALNAMRSYTGSGGNEHDDE